MSLSTNIDHLSMTAGVESVVVASPLKGREYRGDGSWHGIADAALDLFRKTDEKTIRMVIGRHTLVIQKEGEETAAVVMPTGHTLAKSLRRMVRRMANKDRAPIANF